MARNVMVELVSGCGQGLQWTEKYIIIQVWETLLRCLTLKESDRGRGQKMKMGR